MSTDSDPGDADRTGSEQEEHDQSDAGESKIRSPCSHNLPALPEMAEGEPVPDPIAALGSLDIVLASVDR